MKRIFALFVIFGVCLSADSVAALSQARAAMNRGELVNAEQILNTAIQEAETASGPNTPVIDTCLEMLTQVYLREKKFQEAAAVQQRRVDTWTKRFGENAVVVGRNLQQLASIERQGGNLADAESHSRRALAIMTAAFTGKPPSAQAASDLADILIAENRLEEADQVLALAQTTYEASVGPKSMLTATIAARRVNILRQSGHVAEATQLAQITSPDVYRVGAQVTQPRILSKVEPKYSEEARKKKLQGSVTLSMVVDASGAPTQIAVLGPLGMGLDEKAVEAVSQWKFAPGTKGGAPVSVYSQIEITFHLL